MSEIRISVDLDVCLGAQNCRHIAPMIFEIGDDGLSHVISHDPSGFELAVAAARSCPSGAITVSRSDDPSLAEAE
jgi:ferredoxin